MKYSCRCGNPECNVCDCLTDYSECICPAANNWRRNPRSYCLNCDCGYCLKQNPDVDLRGLERNASEGGVEDEAILLAEYRRRGMLTQEQIDIASFYRSPSARLAGSSSRAETLLVKIDEGETTSATALVRYLFPQGDCDLCNSSGIVDGEECQCFYQTCTNYDFLLRRGLAAATVAFEDLRKSWLGLKQARDLPTIINFIGIAIDSIRDELDRFRNPDDPGPSSYFIELSRQIRLHLAITRLTPKRLWLLRSLESLLTSYWAIVNNIPIVNTGSSFQDAVYYAATSYREEGYTPPPQVRGRIALGLPPWTIEEARGAIHIESEKILIPWLLNPYRN